MFFNRVPIFITKDPYWTWIAPLKDIDNSKKKLTLDQLRTIEILRKQVLDHLSLSSYENRVFAENIFELGYLTALSTTMEYYED